MESFHHHCIVPQLGAHTDTNRKVENDTCLLTYFLSIVQQLVRTHSSRNRELIQVDAGGVGEREWGRRGRRGGQQKAIQT